ncbi:MAG TPA: PilZ domain-containing protein [Terriglobales bacterium]|nr:PilZ domain-containing protein [Terriglobales bacterium]
MGKAKSSPKAADWTRLLADPVLAKQLGKLLQICRDTAPENREKALFEAIREIRASSEGAKPGAAALPEPAAQDVTNTPASAPPFEPDIFTPSWGEDRRRYPRLKCFVAVELKVDGSDKPFWGNVSNISLGGCLVEAPSLVEAGKKIEIGLWISSGNLWVKGVVLTGTVASKAAASGVRVRFSDLEATARETLKQFLKYVETTTKSYHNDHGYLAQLRS